MTRFHFHSPNLHRANIKAPQRKNFVDTKRGQEKRIIFVWFIIWAYILTQLLYFKYYRKEANTNIYSCNINLIYNTFNMLFITSPTDISESEVSASLAVQSNGSFTITIQWPVQCIC